jgi:hypothetical protein
MMSATIPTMRMEPIQRYDDLSSVTFDTIANNMMACVLDSWSTAPSSKNTAVVSCEHDTKKSFSDFSKFNHQSILPTPIKRDQVTVVKEIKLGSWWHSDDDTELLKQLLLVPKPLDHHQANSPTKSYSCTASASLIVKSQGDDDLEESHIDGDAPSKEDQDTRLNGDNATEKWNERFNNLVKYRERHGHCLVPNAWKGDMQLAQWVKRQRYQFKLKLEGMHSTLSDKRMNSLNSIGFVWSRQSSSWEERYIELVEFARHHGHCHVPSTYPDNRRLSVWVRCQRRQYKLTQSSLPGYMTPERIGRLTALGFVFNPRNMK